FTLTAQNSLKTVTQAFTVSVRQPPVLTSAPTASFTQGQPGSFTITSAGFPTAAVTETGVLPLGLIVVKKLDGTAVLIGKPLVRGVLRLTISASDGVLPAAFQTFVLTVL